jgi:hypothetical protein
MNVDRAMFAFAGTMMLLSVLLTISFRRGGCC